MSAILRAGYLRNFPIRFRTSFFYSSRILILRTVRQVLSRRTKKVIISFIVLCHEVKLCNGGGAICREAEKLPVGFPETRFVAGTAISGRDLPSLIGGAEGSFRHLFA